MLTLTLFVLFVILFLIFRDFRKTIFFIGLTIKGMLNPSEKNMEKMNELIKIYSKRPFFLKIFHLIFFTKIRFFVNRASERDNFIPRIDLLMNNLNKYSFDKVYTKKRLARILRKYDRILQNTLYREGVNTPIETMSLLHHIFKLNRHCDLPHFNLTLKAGRDVLMVLMKNFFLDPTNGIDKRVLKKLEAFFEDPEKVFIHKLIELKPAA